MLSCLLSYQNQMLLNELKIKSVTKSLLAATSLSQPNSGLEEIRQIHNASKALRRLMHSGWLDWFPASVSLVLGSFFMDSNNKYRVRKLKQWMKHSGIIHVFPDPQLDPEDPYDPDYHFRAFSPEKREYQRHARWSVLRNTQDNWKIEAGTSEFKNSTVKWDDEGIQQLEAISKQIKIDSLLREDSHEFFIMKMRSEAAQRITRNFLLKFRSWVQTRAKWTRISGLEHARHKTLIKLRKIQTDTEALQRRGGCGEMERIQARDILQLLTLETDSIIMSTCLLDFALD